MFRKFFLFVLTLFCIAVSPLATATEKSVQNHQHHHLVGRMVRASWYGPGFQGKPMANGKPFNMHKMTVAHKTLPLGTRVRLRNPENGREINVSVTDRGPYVRGREFDLSKAAAAQLGFRGVARLQVVQVAYNY